MDRAYSNKKPQLPEPARNNNSHTDMYSLHSELSVTPTSTKRPQRMRFLSRLFIHRRTTHGHMLTFTQLMWLKNHYRYNNKKDGYHQLNVHQLGSLRPWDHRNYTHRYKRYMDWKRIQCLSNASQHVPIYYLQPFLRYSGKSVASDWFSTVLVSEWAFLNHILLSLSTPMGQSR